MERDGLSREEALQQIASALEEVREGADPEEVLADWFDLEPDYLYDLLD
jgi:uncharacterized protein (DUF433 family)